MAVSVEIAFLIFGGVLILGYIGEVLSKRFSVPSALMLLALGFALKISGLAEAGQLSGIQGLFGSLALAILLFDGGISLNMRDVLFRSGRVLLNAILLTALGMLGAAGLFHLLGMDPYLGAIMGAIAGGIGASTTMSLIGGLKLPQGIRTFLTLESTLTDIFSIIIAVVMSEALILGLFDTQQIAREMLVQLAVGLIVGIAMGVASFLLLKRIRKGYRYMMSLSLVLICFALSGYLGGNGPIAVLALGMVFGNAAKLMEEEGTEAIRSHLLIKELQQEIVFFIRTFFFVFLGVVVGLGSIDNLLIALAFVALLYLIRVISLRVVGIGSPEIAKYRPLLIAINPRGLATAVLATSPLLLAREALASSADPRLMTILPQMEALPEIAFYTIILTIVATTFLVPISMKAKGIDRKAGLTSPRGR